jgi:metallo-beta-lactamase family protein
MLEGGRIQQHIINNLGNAYCTLLMIGFCAEGTFGDQLLKAKETIRIGDKHYKIQCKIKQTDVLSGHGDRDDLIKFIKAQPSDKLKNIFLVHGEEESMIAFKDTLAEIGYTHVEIPEKGQTFEL